LEPGAALSFELAPEFLAPDEGADEGSEGADPDDDGGEDDCEDDDCEGEGCESPCVGCCAQTPAQNANTKPKYHPARMQLFYSLCAGHDWARPVIWIAKATFNFVILREAGGSEATRARVEESLPSQLTTPHKKTRPLISSGQLAKFLRGRKEKVYIEDGLFCPVVGVVVG
jgi:hypothetical protein